jgi:predicted phage terminase large subunit-like protein
MFFVPPQFGKTECISKKFPTWVFGKCPDLKIVGTSYSAELAQQFSRAIQRTLEDEKYKSLFPDTRLSNGQNGYTRNIDHFDLFGSKGFYKCCGVCGSLTGTPVDIAIIDDPVKDAMEAYSQTYRDRVWEWYSTVLCTRLHNDSKQLLVMTRWHEDDLAGRILKKECDKWEVVSIPALRESLSDGNDQDPRQIGDSLWEERHSREQLLEAQHRSPRTFAALYQQHPTVDGGNIIKKDWFWTAEDSDTISLMSRYPIHFFIDTAYTEKTSNDPTGIIGAMFVKGYLYITCATKVNMKFPDLCRFIPKYVSEHGYTSKSTIRIEPKANGLSVIDQLREQTRLNVVSTPTPKESKEVRLNSVSPIVESHHVFLLKGDWTEAFVNEVSSFPTAPHDEYVDLLCYAINYMEQAAAPSVSDEEILRWML